MLLICGAQLMFDTATGAIFGPEFEPLDNGETLHTIDQARHRAHDWIDHVFREFTEELQAKEN
jgi:hypothetical protein